MQDRKQRVVLIGYMFSGKTTLGKKLAKALNYDFYDLDKEIETRFHYTVADIFAQFGEYTFRNMEKDMLQFLLTKNHCVIATGGGTPCFFDNMQKITQQSLSVYIRMNAKAILSRQKQSKKVRPLFKGLDESEIAEYVNKSLKERDFFYNQADITIEGISYNIDNLISIIHSF